MSTFNSLMSLFVLSGETFITIIEVYDPNVEYTSEYWVGNLLCLCWTNPEAGRRKRITRQVSGFVQWVKFRPAGLLISFAMHDQSFSRFHIFISRNSPTPTRGLSVLLTFQWFFCCCRVIVTYPRIAIPLYIILLEALYQTPWFLMNYFCDYLHLLQHMFP